MMATLLLALVPRQLHAEEGARADKDTSASNAPTKDEKRHAARVAVGAAVLAVVSMTVLVRRLGRAARVEAADRALDEAFDALEAGNERRSRS